MMHSDIFHILFCTLVRKITYVEWIGEKEL